MMRRRRRRVMVAGAVVVGTAESMVKLSQQDAQKIQATTGKAPEDMDEQELQQAMQQSGVQAQPVTAEDQQAMSAAEAADPQEG
jgi:non-canonical (house-cleaning) NTP pyrophosphatase